MKVNKSLRGPHHIRLLTLQVLPDCRQDGKILHSFCDAENQNVSVNMTVFLVVQPRKVIGQRPQQLFMVNDLSVVITSTVQCNSLFTLSFNTRDVGSIASVESTLFTFIQIHNFSIY